MIRPTMSHAANLNRGRMTMSYENTLEKVIIRLDGEEKEKDKRIAELEKELTELKAYKAKLLAHVKYSSTQEEVEIIKLEQQAKGVNDFKKWVLDTDENTSGLDVRDIGLIEFYVEPLIRQAKALKEQDN